MFLNQPACGKSGLPHAVSPIKIKVTRTWRAVTAFLVKEETGNMATTAHYFGIVSRSSLGYTDPTHV
jgi:hypothetical protein